MQETLAIIGSHASAMLNFRGPLIEALVSKGIAVFALAPDFDETTRQAMRQLGAKPVDHRLARTGMNPFRDAFAVAHLASALRGIKPDLVLGYTAKPVIYGTLAAWVAGVPKRFAMIEGLGHVFIDDQSVRSSVLRVAVSLLYRLALSRASRTFFLNADDMSDFTAMRLVHPHRAENIGAIGVDLGAWKTAPPVLEHLTFLFVGRLLREKGIVEFIEAARRVKAQHPDVRFVVLGDTDSNPSSIDASQVRAWVNEGTIVWPGHVPVQPWMAQTSVFVLPSYREGVPRASQEAMAMGRPVITTDVPGCRDTVENGDNGYIVPAKDIEALQAAILRFVRNPALVGQMGARSRTIAEERFDVRVANARTMKAMGL